MIKFSRSNTSFVHLLFLSVIALAIMPVMVCSDNVNTVDTVTITGVNEFYTEADAAGGVKTLETTIRVKMPHSSHEKSGISCETCHHKKGNDERIKKCAYCHKGLAGAKMFHTSCVKCHTEMNKGPVRCNECHIEKQEKQVYKDIEIMYGKTFVFDDKSHKTHENAKIDCSQCHQLRQLDSCD